MTIPLQIVFRDIPQSDAIEAEIRKRAAKLEQASQKITSCRVTVEAAGRHKQQGVQRGVHIDVKFPRGEVAVTRHHADEDLYVAIRDAFDAVRRKMEEHVRREQGEVKTHPEPLHGRVVRLNDEGFGFIEDAAGQEFYFSRDNVAAPDFDQLAIGTEVQFLEATGSEGLQARRVTAGKHRFG